MGRTDVRMEVKRGVAGKGSIKRAKGGEGKVKGEGELTHR